MFIRKRKNVPNTIGTFWRKYDHSVMQHDKPNETK
jgi:hypothetical protein